MCGRALFSLKVLGFAVGIPSFVSEFYSLFHQVFLGCIRVLFGEFLKGLGDEEREHWVISIHVLIIPHYTGIASLFFVVILAKRNCGKQKNH